MTITCCNVETIGNFCQVCGKPVAFETAPGPKMDPGQMVTIWQALKTDLAEARERYEAVATEMNELRTRLAEDHEIQLQQQDQEVAVPQEATEPPRTETHRPLSSSDVAPLVPETPPVDPAKPVEVPASQPNPSGAPTKVLVGTRTGAMGHVDQSASANEVPIGPSEAARNAAREGTSVHQRPVGTIEDSQDGKADPAVDEARARSGAGEGETDSPEAFQAAVAQTLARAASGDR